MTKTTQKTLINQSCMIVLTVFKLMKMNSVIFRAMTVHGWIKSCHAVFNLTLGPASTTLYSCPLNVRFPCCNRPRVPRRRKRDEPAHARVVGEDAAPVRVASFPRRRRPHPRPHRYHVETHRHLPLLLPTLCTLCTTFRPRSSSLPCTLCRTPAFPSSGTRTS